MLERRLIDHLPKIFELAPGAERVNEEQPDLDDKNGRPTLTIVGDQVEPLVNPGPIALRQGAYLWDVHVDGEHKRWQLDYPYGEFPISRGDFSHKDRIYNVQAAWTNMLSVTLVEVLESRSA